MASAAARRSSTPPTAARYTSPRSSRWRYTRGPNGPANPRPETQYTQPPQRPGGSRAARAAVATGGLAAAVGLSAVVRRPGRPGAAPSRFSLTAESRQRQRFDLRLFLWGTGLPGAAAGTRSAMPNLRRVIPPLLRQAAGDRLGLGAAAQSDRSRRLAPRTRTADRVGRSVCPYCAVGCGQKV